MLVLKELAGVVLGRRRRANRVRAMARASSAGVWVVEVGGSGDWAGGLGGGAGEFAGAGVTAVFSMVDAVGARRDPSLRSG